MEEEDTKQCPNCKREIPSINFTTHSVHCARNLRTCPVCKEPVPVAQLQEHHDALHKEVPCKKCGESVCGTDLEDHIRDSCAQTIKPCRYCELELPRHALPAHESYCGARSEQCPECREYVMLKYRQLHLDSNHGFIRLEEDPVPKEAKPKPITNGFPNPSTSRLQNGPLRTDNPRPRPQTEIRFYAGSSNLDRVANSVNNGTKNDNRAVGSSNVDRVVNNDRGFNNLDRVERNGKVIMKRTNDQPQINTSMEPREKVHKDLPSRGAVKKRPAPPPPAPAPAPPAPDPRRDLPYWSATRRAQDEERKRQEQTAYNLSVGLPPVLSPAAKLEKLRKMDALHNRELEEDYSHRLRGRAPPEPEPAGHRLDDLSNLRPMTAQQFMDRFQELQLGAGRQPAAAPATARAPAPAPAPAPATGARAGAGVSADRFSEIKSSLRELRRGLNEVTAPYNSASNATNNAQIDSSRLSPMGAAGAGDGAECRLPCEFCGAAVPADELVMHQTGCRPDLAQYRPRKPSRSHSPRVRTRSPSDTEEPVIPCEFCTESLPVYLISEHQERCRREANILYPD